MIVDTSALLAILFEEAEEAAFTSAVLRAEPARMSAATFVEAHVVVIRRRPEKAARLGPLIEELGIRIEPLTLDHARAARDGFARFGQTRHPAALNFGDCFAYALAATTGEPLLFKGEDFARTDVRRVL